MWFRRLRAERRAPTAPRSLVTGDYRAQLIRRVRPVTGWMTSGELSSRGPCPAICHASPLTPETLRGSEVGSAETLQLKWRLQDVEPGQKVEVEPYMLYRCDADPGPLPHGAHLPLRRNRRPGRQDRPDARREYGRGHDESDRRGPVIGRSAARTSWHCIAGEGGDRFFSRFPIFFFSSSFARARKQDF
jgi:hypothetical protein